MSIDIQELKARWEVLIELRAALERQDEDAKAELDQIKSAIFAALEDQGLTGMDFDDAKIYMQAVAYPKIVGDPEKVIEWLDGYGTPDAAPRKIKLGRLKEILEDALENDKPLPPNELVEFQSGKELRMKRKRKGASNETN